MASDPLLALLVDENEIAREELAAVLKPFLRFSAQGLIFEPAFDALPARSRVCCVLLALRAAQLLGLRESAQATPKEIADMTSIPPGTVRPKLRELVGLRVARTTGSSYEVPVHAMRYAIAQVQS